MNWYAYVANNPLMFVDPSGLEAWDFYNSLGNGNSSGADRDFYFDDALLNGVHSDFFEQLISYQDELFNFYSTIEDVKLFIVEWSTHSNSEWYADEITELKAKLLSSPVAAHNPELIKRIFNLSVTDPSDWDEFEIEFLSMNNHSDLIREEFILNLINDSAKTLMFISAWRARTGQGNRLPKKVDIRPSNQYNNGTTFKSWNDFQRGTRGMFSSRTEASRAWKLYKAQNGIFTGTTRSMAVRNSFLKQCMTSGKYAKWMNNWLQQGKVPPGYQVDHIVALSAGGADVTSNMRLKPVDVHIKWHSEFYHPWR